MDSTDYEPRDKVTMRRKVLNNSTMELEDIIVAQQQQIDILISSNQSLQKKLDILTSQFESLNFKNISGCYFSSEGNKNNMLKYDVKKNKLKHKFNNYKKLVCYHCGGNYHKTVNCRYRLDLCFRCGSPSHMVHQCRYPSKYNVLNVRYKKSQSQKYSGRGKRFNYFQGDISYDNHVNANHKEIRLSKHPSYNEFMEPELPKPQREPKVYQWRNPKLKSILSETSEIRRPNIVIKGESLLAGSGVQVIFDNVSKGGIVRWIGNVIVNKEAANYVGIELKDFEYGLSDGIFNGKRYFYCPIGKALFVPTQKCQVKEYEKCEYVISKVNGSQDEKVCIEIEDKVEDGVSESKEEKFKQCDFVEVLLSLEENSENTNEIIRNNNSEIEDTNLSSKANGEDDLSNSETKIENGIVWPDSAHFRCDDNEKSNLDDFNDEFLSSLKECDNKKISKDLNDNILDFEHLKHLLEKERNYIKDNLSRGATHLDNKLKMKSTTNIIKDNQFTPEKEYTKVNDNEIIKSAREVLNRVPIILWSESSSLTHINKGEKVKEEKNYDLTSVLTSIDEIFSNGNTVIENKETETPNQEAVSQIKPTGILDEKIKLDKSEDEPSFSSKALTDVKSEKLDNSKDMVIIIGKESLTVEKEFICQAEGCHQFGSSMCQQCFQHFFRLSLYCSTECEQKLQELEKSIHEGRIVECQDNCKTGKCFHCRKARCNLMEDFGKKVDRYLYLHRQFENLKTKMN